MTANNSLIDFGKRSSLLIASQCIKLLVQLLILFLYSRLLSVNEYGRYQLVWLISNVISVVGLFGLPSLLLSYPLANIQTYIGQKRRQLIVYGTLLQLIPLLYLLFSIQTWPTVEVVLLVMMTWIQYASILAETLAIKQQEESKLLGVNLLHQFLFLGIHLLVYVNNYQLVYLLWGLILSLLIKIACLWDPFLTLFKKSSSTAIDEVIETDSIGSQWLFLGANDLMLVLFKWIDKWLILLLLSVSQFALYFNGAYEIPVFTLMVSAVGNIMLVDMAKHKNSSKTIQTFHRSAYLLSAFVFPAFGYLIFFHEELFTFLFSQKYEAALPIFFISLMVLPVRITNFTAALQVRQKTHIILMGSVIDILVALGLTVWLYPLMGLPGMALAFVLSTWIQAFYYSWQTASLLQTPIWALLPFFYLGIWLAINIIAMALCKYIIPANEMLINMGIAAMVAGVLAISMWFQYRKKNREEVAPPY
jgi:O-antigen/teichoic acid export membrane protein